VKEALEAAAREYCRQISWKPGTLFSVVRLAATGRTAAPPLFDTLEVLGKEIVRRRLRQAADFVRQAELD
jgi:glutamyl-tRNA synthetase